MRKSILLLAATIPPFIAGATAAFAQGTEQATASRNYGDIIVTARKRQESVLQVPVIETVISGEELQQSQINDINSLTEKVAGLQVGGNVLTSQRITDLVLQAFGACANSQVGGLFGMFVVWFSVFIELFLLLYY